MTDADRIAFEEIYRLSLKHSGGVERKIRRICEAVLGTRAAAVRADFAANKTETRNQKPTTLNPQPTTLS